MNLNYYQMKCWRTLSLRFPITKRVVKIFQICNWKSTIPNNF